MTNSTFQNRFSEKGRRTDEPGAKVMGTCNGAAGNPPRAKHGVSAMGASLGKNNGTFSGLNRGTFPAQNSGNLPVGNAKNSSVLAPLDRNELIDEWKAIILPLPIKRAAEEQVATTRAVESQRNGDSAASLLAAINQARANPRVRAQLGRLMGFTGCYTDPDFMEGMELIGQSYMREQFMRVAVAQEVYSTPDEPAADDDSTDANDDRDDLTGDLFGSLN